MPPGFNVHLAMGDFANLWWLSSAVLHLRDAGYEAELAPKLTLLAKGDPLQLSAGDQSGERDVLFEVICACICSLFASDVRFQEPDLICRYADSSWGLACKVAYGTPAQTAKGIRKGMRQIEGSAADLGIVVVQLTNRFPHDKMYDVDPSTGEIVLTAQ